MTADARFHAATQGTLAHRFKLTWCGRSASEVLRHAPRQDLIILEYGRFHAEAVALFERLHKQYPTTCVMLAITPADFEVGLELLKVGLTDVIVLPANPQVLLRKTVRAVLGATWPAISVPGLTEEPPEILPRPSDGSVSERRKSFRVRVGDSRQVALIIQGPAGPERFVVWDLSIGIDSWHGGLSFVLPSAKHSIAPYCRWDAGTHIQALMTIRGMASPMPVDFVVRRWVRAGTAMLVAGQYRPGRAEDDRQIRRFWVKAQQKARDKAA